MKYSTPEIHEVGPAEELIQGSIGEFTELGGNYKMTPPNE